MDKRPTREQQRKMLSALNMVNSYKVVDGVYKATRNRYLCGAKAKADWEELERNGFAERSDKVLPIYRVTAKGKLFIGDRLGVKIEEPCTL